MQVYKRKPSVVPTLYIYGPLNGKLETGDRMQYTHRDGMYVRVETIRSESPRTFIDDLLDWFLDDDRKQFQKPSDTCEYVFHHIPMFKKEIIQDVLRIKIPMFSFPVPSFLKKLDTFCATMVFIPYDKLTPDDVADLSNVMLQAATIWSSLLNAHSSPEIAQYMFFEEFEFPAQWQTDDGPSKLTLPPSG